MISNYFLRVIRRCQRRHGLVAFFINSHGFHTETSIMLDSTGSAYQVAVQLSKLTMRPTITVSEYIAGTHIVIRQERIVSWVLAFAHDYERAVQQVFGWIAGKNAQRLFQMEELRLANEMFQRLH
jgi:hypothetical protein